MNESTTPGQEAAEAFVWGVTQAVNDDSKFYEKEIPFELAGNKGFHYQRVKFKFDQLVYDENNKQVDKYNYMGDTYPSLIVRISVEPNEYLGKTSEYNCFSVDYDTVNNEMSGAMILYGINNPKEECTSLPQKSLGTNLLNMIDVIAFYLGAKSNSLEDASTISAKGFPNKTKSGKTRVCGQSKTGVQIDFPALKILTDSVNKNRDLLFESSLLSWYESKKYQLIATELQNNMQDWITLMRTDENTVVSRMLASLGTNAKYVNFTPAVQMKYREAIRNMPFITFYKFCSIMKRIIGLYPANEDEKARFEEYKNRRDFWDTIKLDRNTKTLTVKESYEFYLGAFQCTKARQLGEVFLQVIAYGDGIDHPFLTKYYTFTSSGTGQTKKTGNKMTTTSLRFWI